MIKLSVENIDYSHFSFEKATVAKGVHLNSSGSSGRIVDASPIMHARKRESGSDWGLAVSHMEQRSRGWATWFNTLWRGWHSNIICHKWGCILQPNSWLKALLAMPIRTVFSHIIRPTCQIAGLIHTEGMHQYTVIGNSNWKPIIFRHGNAVRHTVTEQIELMMYSRTSNGRTTEQFSIRTVLFWLCTWI